MRRAMDYVFTMDDQEILIEGVQKDTRSQVIEKYVQCRKEKKMTQEELARLAGISRPNVTRFESGNYNPSLELLVRIAAAMGMELEINLVKKKDNP